MSARACFHSAWQDLAAPARSARLCLGGRLWFSGKKGAVVERGRERSRAFSVVGDSCRGCQRATLAAGSRRSSAKWRRSGRPSGGFEVRSWATAVGWRWRRLPTEMSDTGRDDGRLHSVVCLQTNLAQARRLGGPLERIEEARFLSAVPVAALLTERAWRRSVRMAYLSRTQGAPGVRGLRRTGAGDPRPRSGEALGAVPSCRAGCDRFRSGRCGPHREVHPSALCDASFERREDSWRRLGAIDPHLHLGEFAAMEASIDVSPTCGRTKFASFRATLLVNLQGRV